VGHIVWSQAAAQVMQRLDPVLREAIERRTAYLRRTPRMYALAQDSRFLGCRSFWAGGVCHVYYMVAAGGDDCYIKVIEEAEPGEESGFADSAGAEQEL
jgi:hypothetical protein